MRSFTFAILLFVSAALLQAQQVRICALRVDFQPDTNPLTTGEGQFIYSSETVTEFTIDPAPHDRAYFYDQIRAVRNYFDAASRGQVQVSGKVFPLAEQAAYRMPQQMGYYSPNSTDEENDRRLAQLFLDAVAAADADVDFSQYDLVTVFHAGVGKDIDIGYDETPQDIPSLYLTPAFFKRALGDDFSGVAVDGMLLNRAIIMPETESQAELEIGMTGIFASNIGSYLGMYDLFNAETQRPAIGRFGLMDVGLLNLFGLVPALPSAFSRQLMGWDTPAIFSEPEESLRIENLTRGEGYPTTIRIPINESEYYLMEYRGERDVNVDSVLIEMYNERGTVPNYLEVLKTYLPDRIEISDSTGVMVRIDDYDWGLPGSGILIWHVDESVIAANAVVNRVNSDDDRRGVDLEEADGSQDIGFEYSIVEPGYQSELGTWLDFWFDGNPAPLYQNDFSEISSPNTHSNRDNAETHIRIDNFSANNTTHMTFSLWFDYFERGFPFTLFSPGDGQISSEPVLGRVGTSRQLVIFVAADNGRVYAFSGNGVRFLPSGYEVLNWGSEEKLSFALYRDPVTLNHSKLIAAAADGQIRGYALGDADSDGQLDELFRYDLGDSLVWGPVIAENRIFAAGGNGNLHRLNPDGSLDEVINPGFPDYSSFTVGGVNEFWINSATEHDPALAPLAVDLDSDGDAELFQVTAEGSVELRNLPSIYRWDRGGRPVAMPAVADVNQDGKYEFIFNSADAIYVLNSELVSLSNTPIFPVLNAGTQLVGTPLIADIDGHSEPDIVVTTDAGTIFAFNLSGELLPGFPLSSGGTAIGSGIISDLDQDGRVEIVQTTQSGAVFAWQCPSGIAADGIVFGQSRLDPGNNNYIWNPPAGTVLPPESELLPTRRAFNYPNPNQDDHTYIRYYLNADADVTINIFDLSGMVIDSFDGPGKGNSDNEIRWNVSDVASGIYLCRIEAKSASDTQTRIIKIMVQH